MKLGTAKSPREMAAWRREAEALLAGNLGGRGDRENESGGCQAPAPAPAPEWLLRPGLPPQPQSPLQPMGGQVLHQGRGYHLHSNKKLQDGGGWTGRAAS